MRHFLVTAPIKPGSRADVARILRDGPPFPLDESTLERHYVFLAGDELVFLFEGPRAEEEAARLMAASRTLDTAGRLAQHLAHGPRFPEEVFGWERPEPTPGVSFAPTPGPGDSEGG